MTLSPLKLLLASLVLTSFAVAGCAADTSAVDEDAEDTDVAQEEITSRAAQYVGSYRWKAGDSGAFVDFQELALKGDGNYTAMVEASLVNPAVRCIKFPCTLAESGKWNVTKSGGKLKIRVNPTGWKPSRSYFVSLEPLSRVLTLTRYNQTTRLFTDASTCANVRCTAGTHCEMQGPSGGQGPVCVADEPVSTCAATTCPVGTTCVETPTGAECESAPVATCAVTLCIAGTKCIETPTGAQCVSFSPCVKTGCSGQVCADRQVMTTCEYRPEYACYASATCTRQASGQCGWTSTPALTSCLSGQQ